MNLIVLQEEDFVRSGGVGFGSRAGVIVICCEIQRVEVGSELRVGLLNGRLGDGRVTALDADSAELEVEAS